MKWQPPLLCFFSNSSERVGQMRRKRENDGNWLTLQCIYIVSTLMTAGFLFPPNKYIVNTLKLFDNAKLTLYLFYLYKGNYSFITKAPRQRESKSKYFQFSESDYIGGSDCVVVTGNVNTLYVLHGARARTCSYKNPIWNRISLPFYTFLFYVHNTRSIKSKLLLIPVNAAN